ncbi:MAG: hypothetical protein GWN16_06135, partial [Calditrichae bacterium]|nr:hypothetical protein [Calditrichia bacterium]
MPLFGSNPNVDRVGQFGGTAATGALMDHLVQHLLNNVSLLIRQLQHAAEQHL